MPVGARAPGESCWNGALRLHGFLSSPKRAARRTEVHLPRTCSVVRSALVALALGAGPGAARAAEYSLAIIPQFEQRRLLETWRPIADELERRTGHRIRIVSTVAVEDFEAEFMKGEWDLVYMNPYIIAKTLGTLGYVPLVRDRVPTRGVLVARKGGPYRRLEDLASKEVAFPTPNAVGGCMVIRAELKGRHGLEVKPVFVKTASNVFLHVAKGLAEAGGAPEKALALLDPGLRERLEVVFTSRELPSHPIAAHPKVPAAERQRIQRALLELAATDAGRALFAKVPMKEPGTATADEYRAMLGWGLDAWYDPGARLE